MKNILYCAIGLMLILLISLLIMGCASEPVKINWSQNHPANPETQEAKFIRPNNPFETDMAAIKEAPDKDAMMDHKMPKESDMHQMENSMGTDNKKHFDSKPKMQPEHSQKHDQHQEHSQ
ncbi:MAG: hypothetical protein R3274_00045 [Desulfobacterales bacterium]|nr:hypothetical protein [Desulfobacterales bacterium]